MAHRYYYTTNRSRAYQHRATENRRDLRLAHEKGAAAAAAGEPLEACPYPDTSTGRFTTKYCHIVAQRRAWITGWKS